MKTSDTFPARLRAARLAAVLSKERLATIAGFTRRSIQLWELGQMSPSLRSVERLATALGVSTEQLLFGK